MVVSIDILDTENRGFSERLHVAFLREEVTLGDRLGYDPPI